MNFKENYKIILISIVIILISFAAVHYEMAEARKNVIIDPQSEYGKELTAIAEKAIEEEGIDTRYLHSGNLVQKSSGTITLTFSGSRSYSGAEVYSNADFGEDEKITFFAADLDRYDIHTYSTQPENGRIYNKDGVTMSGIYGQGKDCSYNIQNNSIELADPETNKVIFILSNYTVNQHANKTDTIADEINSKFASVQQPLPIDKEKTYIIMDVNMNDENGHLTIETAFYKGELYSMHIQESTKEENTKKGFYTTTISHGVRFYDE
ncbi:MAG: hypothetical protein PWQ63_1518 [Methanolobus sp.]|jgi:hypothetical protein|uniref:hypothetical protein n=1 Tax=Methanolobus sp. TaxID=1874737 RepID=UPI0024AA9CA3|nr:hypothetical protein [Methanolobus sp.]MDI3487115.1 hypothetical protein [Methanolobus sp.]MDK2830503.1 hypothetical protein [Methanolobus sp.]MDK2948358.1 hypothetical protein [Methanolobus sp.]